MPDAIERDGGSVFRNYFLHDCFRAERRRRYRFAACVAALFLLTQLGREFLPEIFRLEHLPNLDLGFPVSTGQRLTHSIASSFDLT